MKAKVLKYKFDGNTVVAPYMELEAYAENIFLLRAVFQGNAWKGGTKRKTCQVLQKLDCEYASGCGKREPCLPFVDPCL